MYLKILFLYPPMFWRKCRKSLIFSPWVQEEDNYSADKSEMLTMSQVSVYLTLKQRAKTVSEALSFPQRNLGLGMSLKCNSWDGNSPQTYGHIQEVMRQRYHRVFTNRITNTAQTKIRLIQIWLVPKKSVLAINFGHILCHLSWLHAV